VSNGRSVHRFQVADMLRRAARRVEGTDALDARMVWLVGAPRTGSTWVLNMLTRHDRVFGVNEPLLGAHLGVLRGDAVATVESDPAGLWEAERRRLRYVFSDDTASTWRPLLADLTRRTLLRMWIDRGAIEDVIVIKEPHGSEGIGLLRSAMPASKLLFLIREPRDCADSVLDIAQSGWAGKGGGTVLEVDQQTRLLEQWATLWRARVSAVQSAFDATVDSQRFLIRYEDIRAEPAQHLEEIFSWLGLASDRAHTEDIAARLSFERVPEEQRGPGQFQRSATPGLWRSNLDPTHQAWLSTFFADELARYGYDPS
jgi:hypothetical protein